MFTIGAFFGVALIAWLVKRNNDRDAYDSSRDDGMWLLLLHVRQDLRLIAFLLGGVIIMLGIIADRLP